jgi:hypothetical protein
MAAVAHKLAAVVICFLFFLFGFLEQVLHGAYSGFLSQLLRSDKRQSLFWAPFDAL